MKGKVLFYSKIEVFCMMLFSAFALITGKFRKLAAAWVIFESLIQVATTAFAVWMLKEEEGSWKAGFNKFKDSLDEEFGIVEEHDESAELEAVNIRANHLETVLEYETRRANTFRDRVAKRDEILQKYSLKNKSLCSEYQNILDGE